MSEQRPVYAYEDAATLAWSAAMARTWLRRRRARLAANTVEQEHTPTDGGGARADAT